MQIKKILLFLLLCDIAAYCMNTLEAKSRFFGYFFVLYNLGRCTPINIRSVGWLDNSRLICPNSCYHRNGYKRMWIEKIFIWTMAKVFCDNYFLSSGHSYLSLVDVLLESFWGDDYNNILSFILPYSSLSHSTAWWQERSGSVVAPPCTYYLNATHHIIFLKCLCR